MNVIMDVLSAGPVVLVNVTFWVTVAYIVLDFGLALYEADAAGSYELRALVFWHQAILVLFAVHAMMWLVWNRPGFIPEYFGMLLAAIALGAIARACDVHVRIEAHLTKQRTAPRGYAPYPLENGDV